MCKRIQRKRSKGWRKPPNTVYVGRESKWGNPFKLMGDIIYYNAKHRRKVFSVWIIHEHTHHFEPKLRNARIVELYNIWINNSFPTEKGIAHCSFNYNDVKRELKGKDLMCWCKLDEPCHADILLRLANGS